MRSTKNDPWRVLCQIWRVQPVRASMTASGRHRTLVCLRKLLPFYRPGAADAHWLKRWLVLLPTM